ncbi:1109_t:CDS:2 [Funneliformis geosporum]|nr:1109_t:CDS:2 [Funneliformis geosporum]
MVKEIIIPKENYKQVEEVRELENENQEQKKVDEKQENKPTITESAKTVHVDTIKEAKQHNADEFRKMERDAAEGDCKIL